MVEEQVEEQQATKTRRVTLKTLTLPSVISVGNLAERVHAEPVQLIKQLMRMGVFANITQVIDFDTASMLARAYGYSAKQLTGAGQQGSEELTEEDAAKLQIRPPVVTVLGHVDHGKTSLLDSIRKANVAGAEKGGITQHIGAYQVDYNNQLITLLDTPGHEAFTAMRARGAQVTDVAVLVVAADDGVMPQTVEAIDHIKAAKVPIIVAINKMDLPDADPDRIKRQLSEHELLVEDWGGEVIAVPVSAKTGEGIEDLLESVVVQSEVEELKANPDRSALGVVIEARTDKSRGVVATLLVQTGTIHQGDNFVVGTIRGRVRALTSDTGRRIKSAGPSQPVEILGLSELPEAGDTLTVVADERSARDLVAERQRSAGARGVTLEDMTSRLSSGTAKELDLILKTDVQGSIDALRQALGQLSTDETQVKLIHASTGTVTESDVLLAVASQAIIIGFNTRTEPGARRMADLEGVDIRLYDIIYRLTEDIEAALAGMLEPKQEDIVEGKLEIRAIFSLGKGRASAGCYVTDGQVARNATARVLRGGQELFDGPILGLKRFKDDARQVTVGYECGVTLDGFNDFKEGDVIEAHRLQRVGGAA
jgi:translation initiation factor IF-2